MDLSHTLNDIAVRIKQRRNELGFSLQDVASMTGMSKSTLQRYENGGIKNIPLQKLDVLARALQTTQEWLLKGGETPTSITLDTIMIDKNISANHLAEALNIPEEVVEGWRTGSSAPKYDVLSELCKILNLDTSEFTDPDSITKEIAAKGEYRILNPFCEQYPTVVKDAAISFMCSLQPLVNRMSEENSDILIPAINCLSDIGNLIIDLLKVFLIRKKSSDIKSFKIEAEKYSSDVSESFAIYTIQLIRMIESQIDYNEK